MFIILVNLQELFCNEFKVPACMFHKNYCENLFPKFNLLKHLLSLALLRYMITPFPYRDNSGRWNLAKSALTFLNPKYIN